jgi:hypothetical protein
MTLHHVQLCAKTRSRKRTSGADSDLNTETLPRVGEKEHCAGVSVAGVMNKVGLPAMAFFTRKMRYLLESIAARIT